MCVVERDGKEGGKEEDEEEEEERENDEELIRSIKQSVRDAIGPFATPDQGYITMSHPFSSKKKKGNMLKMR